MLAGKAFKKIRGARQSASGGEKLVCQASHSCRAAVLRPAKIAVPEGLGVAMLSNRCCNRGFLFSYWNSCQSENPENVFFATAAACPVLCAATVAPADLALPFAALGQSLCEREALGNDAVDSRIECQADVRPRNFEINFGVIGPAATPVDDSVAAGVNGSGQHVGG